MMPSWAHPFPRPGGSSSGPGSSSWQRGPSGRTGSHHPSLRPTPRARGAAGRTIPRPRSATGAGRPCIEGSDPRPDSPGRWSGPSGRSSDLRRKCWRDERASLRPKRWCASEHPAPTGAGDAPRLGVLAELKERSLDRSPLANAHILEELKELRGATPGPPDAWHVQAFRREGAEQALLQRLARKQRRPGSAARSARGSLEWATHLHDGLDRPTR